MDDAVRSAVEALREARKQPRKPRTQTYTNKVHGIDKKTRNLEHVKGELAAAGHLGDGAGACKVHRSVMEAAAELVLREKLAIKSAIKKPGQLHRDLGVPEGEKIPAEKIKAAAKRKDKVGARARFALTLKKVREAEEISQEDLDAALEDE